MLWILFTSLAAVIWAVVDLVDKFIIDQEIREPGAATTLFGFSIFLVFFIAFGFFQKITFSPAILIPSLASGLFYFAAIRIYFSGLKMEGVSRFAPTLSTTTVFIVLFAFLFLGEAFTWPVYCGIALAILGAVFISLEDPRRSLQKMKSKEGFLLAILAALFFGSRDTILKFATGQATLWSVLFWVGIGILLPSLALLVWHFSQVRSEAKRGVEHLIAVGILSASGYLVYAKAVSLGSVSLVSAVLKVKVFVVFFGSVMISKFHPEIIFEEMDKATLVQKLAATGMIVSGVILIQLFS